MSALAANRSRTLALITLGSLLGISITLGVLLGLNVISNGTDTTNDTESIAREGVNRSPGDVKKLSANGTIDRERDLGLLKFLNQAPSAFERTEALYSLLLSADASMLTDLLKQSNNIGSEHLQHSTQTAIVQRFAAVDFRLALSTIESLPFDRHDPLTATVFGEIAQLDFDEAIAHAKTLDELKKYSALQGIFGSQENLSKDKKREIANELQIDLTVFERSAPTNSFTEEWHALLADERANLAQTADLIRIAHKWVDVSGLEAIAHIDESLHDSILKKAVIGSVLQRALLSDAQETLQQVLNFEEDLREFVLETIARAWASIGPEEAMESIAAIETHRLRRQMLEHFVTAWANFDPKEIFEQFDLIPENLRPLAQENAIRTLAKTTPSEAVQYLKEVTDELLRFDLTMEIVTRWSDKNALEALEWALSEEFSNDPLDRMLENQMLNTVLRSLAAENPELALQTALDQPADRMGLGLEATVIEEVARTDIERAMSMLAQVREGFTQSFAAVAVGQALVANNETDRALALAEQLPDNFRDFYYNLVVNEWAYSDPKSLVNNLDQLPTTEAQYTAAMDLVRRNVGTNILSKEQMSLVKSFLPEDYNSETGRRGSESAQFARLNNLQNKELTDEERAQAQRDFQKLILDGRYRRYRFD